MYIILFIIIKFNYKNVITVGTHKNIVVNTCNNITKLIKFIFFQIEKYYIRNIFNIKYINII